MTGDETKTKKALSEQRNATRTGGRFAKMDPCEVCGRPGTLEPAFGGDYAPDDPDPTCGKLICARCVKAAIKRRTTRK